MSYIDEVELIDLAGAAGGSEARERLLSYQPYAKQRAFHAAGANRRERLLMAGNQLGKTYCGAAEAAFHLTGLYPAWWEGRRWDRPVRAWAGSKTGEVTRDGVQRLLVGEPRDRGAWGKGMIPAERLVERKLKTTTPDALASVTVQHVSGGVSVLGFKSYDQGREKWQGETLDFVWFDEEPPLDVYFEGLTRTNATGGMAFMTFTPLLGMSEVVSLFLDEKGNQSASSGLADSSRVGGLWPLRGGAPRAFGER